MSEPKKLELKLLATGVPGLDEVLGGGLPEYSVNLVAGTPGSGKTTLVHQVVFANASVERPALYFTVVGEPPLKMLRYQQQLEFFDPAKVGTAIRFVDLSAEVLGGDLNRVLAAILQHVQDANPAIVVIDSFRSVLRAKMARAITVAEQLELQEFLQRLAVQLTSWQVTSFLIGEYSETEMTDNPVFTIADAILWLTQEKDRNSMVRKIEVMKLRGLASIPGLHTFRMSANGIQVFPRTTWGVEDDRQLPKGRMSCGVPELDALLGGGLPIGDTTLVAGPSGTGKTVLATQFVAEGIRHGESAVLAIFEEHPKDYLERAKSLGFDLQAMVNQGVLRVVYLRPLDLCAEEILYAIQQCVASIGATRLVIDSLNGLELALAPTFREDYREALYRLVGRLTGKGVSILLTVEVPETFESIRFSPHDVSFIAQNILFLRYVEIAARLRKMIVVIKMRRSDHSKVMHEIEITPTGLKVMQAFTEFRGILRGTPTRLARPERTPATGLTSHENVLLDMLLRAGELSAEALAEATGYPMAEITRAVARLVSLNYVLTDASRTLYRPAERPLGGL